MRGKKPKRPTTPPSEGEEDSTFVVDPDQIFDELPQPFRLIDKTLRELFDNAWETIEDIEQYKALRRSKAVLPLFELGKQLSEYKNTTCLCTVGDGRFLFVGYSGGLAVVDSETGTTVAAFEDPGKSFVQMSACCLQEGVYLVCVLDSLGFAKLFCFCGDKVLHVRTFNEQEGTNKQAVVTLIQISQDGGYVGIGWEVPSKESWLEVYKVPRETWIKEAETVIAALSRMKPTISDQPTQEGEESATTEQLLKSAEEQEPPAGTSPPGSRPSSAQGQLPPAATAASFTKPTAVLRVRPPAPVGPCAATNCSAALKAIDAECNVIGSGATHVLLSQYFDNCDKTFQGLHEQQLQYLNNDEQDLTSLPGIHFLTPGKLISSGLESSPKKVNSLVAWWSGGTQLFMYSLVKTAKDIEHKPDVVWPNSEKILISTISKCGSLMAMGLNNGTVVVWDVYRGTLLRVCPITNKGQIICLHFLPSGVVPLLTDDQESHISTPSSHADLVVSCDDGTFSLVQCGVVHSPQPQPLVDESAVETEAITDVVMLPRTPQVIAAVKKSGRITLYDVANFTAICHVGLPDSYLLSSRPPCVCCGGRMLVLIGAQEEEDDNEEAQNNETAIPFAYSLQTFPTLNDYWREEEIESSPYKANSTLDARFHSLIQDRLVSQGSRQSRLQHRWSQYQTELKNIQNNKTRRNHSTWLTAKSSVF